jgi:endonuclease YncB( thermonuclease family)
MRRIALLAALFSALASACSPDAADPGPGTSAPAVTGAPAASVPAGTAAPLPAGPEGEILEDAWALDGDSLRATLGGREVEIRLLGVNAPERDECRADDSRAALATLVGTAAVRFDDRGEDQFGRRLGYLTAGGVFVNAALLATGDALAIRSEHPFESEFLAVQEAATAAGIGLWAPDACGPALGADVRIDRVDGNPPGPDDDPASGETVTIRNHGDAPVDLGGWVLRDESSVHRYRFATGTELSPGSTITVHSTCGASEHCFGDGGAVWSNGGDTALLLDPSGNVVDRYPFDG